jgi:hypothetical protein
MRIGLIQTRGIGDIVIAMPIAAHFIRQGHQVFWPVDSEFLPFLAAAFPEVGFVPVDCALRGSLDYFYTLPRRELAQRGCDKLLCLYSALGEPKSLIDNRLVQSLKFDEYKYAVAGVPFAEKWNLKLVRDAAAEQRLRESLGITGPYAVTHTEVGEMKFELDLPEAVSREWQVVPIRPLTPNPLDWLGVIEGASMIAMVDSCFANLVEQLDLGRNRHFIVRSGMAFTPVLRNGWTFH